MSSLFVALFALVASSFRTRAALQAEILALRHQLAVFQKNAPPRLRFQRSDRLLWVLLSRWWPGWRRSLHIVRPETVIAWHRRAFAWYWTRKSRRRAGRPNVAAEIRNLIRDMSQANPLWGAPRIHGELLKLGIKMAPSTVAKYLRRPWKPPSQTRRAFLVNHAEQMASIDFFTVPTATFRVLFVFVVLSHARRRVLHFQVTERPTQEWTMQQIREAFPWEQVPRYLLRDRDAIYGRDFAALTTGMEEVVTAPRAPWQTARMSGPRHRLESTIVTPDPTKLFCLLPAFTNGVCNSSGRRTPSPIPASRCLVNPNRRRAAGADVLLAGLDTASPDLLNRADSSGIRTEYFRDMNSIAGMYWAIGTYQKTSTPSEEPRGSCFGIQSNW
jgi:putative transposase